jgi:hypothetical protein
MISENTFGVGHERFVGVNSVITRPCSSAPKFFGPTEQPQMLSGLATSALLQKICLAKVTSRWEIAPRYEDREQDRSRARLGRVSR